MYRYERPQKGRYREFHQVGAEIIGSNNNNASANCVEILRGSVNFLQNLNVEFSLIINTIGISEDRDKYMKTLEKYFYSNKSKLSDESVKRIDTNPLRILDSKEDSDIEVVSGAPSFKEFISNESLNHYSKIKSMLDKFDIEYTENEYLIRGLDYYNDFTFEMHPISKSGSQYALGGGGQYDNLSSLISNKQINGIGVAFGVDRLIELIEMDNTNNE
jgi:histidyl-tRNA synthetase